MNVSRNLITKLSQIKGGQTYIEMCCLHGSLWHPTTVRIVGVPYREKGVGSFFGITRETNSWNKNQSYDSLIGYRDKNVTPNSYNDHSLWRFNTKTLKYLESLVAKGEEGVAEYLSHLAKQKRGKTYHREVLAT